MVQLCEIPVVNQIEVDQRKSKQELVEIVDKSANEEQGGGDSCTAFTKR